MPPSPATGPLYLPHCVVDLDEGTVHTGEERRRLSAKESALLRYLVARPGEVIDRYTLLEDVWGYDSSRVVSRAVDTSICRLRRKLEADPAAPRHLRTLRPARGGGGRAAASDHQPGGARWGVLRAGRWAGVAAGAGAAGHRHRALGPRRRGQDPARAPVGGGTARLGPHVVGRRLAL